MTAMLPRNVAVGVSLMRAGLQIGRWRESMAQGAAILSERLADGPAVAVVRGVTLDCPSYKFAKSQMPIIDAQVHLWRTGDPNPPHRAAPYLVEDAILV